MKASFDEGTPTVTVVSENWDDSLKMSALTAAYDVIQNLRKIDDGKFCSDVLDAIAAGDSLMIFSMKSCLEGGIEWT